jgi:hypothetical protein
MAFNHYAKLKRILEDYPGWYIIRINKPTSAKNFKGEVKKFDHYYRLYSALDQPIKFGKFQQLELFARTMNLSLEDLPVVDQARDL